MNTESIQTHTPSEAAQPRPPMSRLALADVLVEENHVVAKFTIQGTLVDPRHIVAGILNEELPRWKETSDEWKRFAPFAARLEEAARDLEEAKAAAAAAKEIWQKAIRGGEDAAPLERNMVEIETRLKIIEERGAALRATEKERKAEMEQAWRKRMQEIFTARRRHCDDFARAARVEIVRSLNPLPILSISEEVRLATLLALGANGLFGLSPRLF